MLNKLKSIISFVVHVTGLLNYLLCLFIPLNISESFKSTMLSIVLVGAPF